LERLLACVWTEMADPAGGMVRAAATSRKPTSTTAWQSGHLTFLPARIAFTLRVLLHWGQVNVKNASAPAGK